MLLAIIVIQWSLLIVFETALFCDNVISKCWLVIGLKTVTTMWPRSNFSSQKPSAGKILLWLSNIVGKTFIAM